MRSFIPKQRLDAFTVKDTPPTGRGKPGNSSRELCGSAAKSRSDFGLHEAAPSRVISKRSFFRRSAGFAGSMLALILAMIVVTAPLPAISQMSGELELALSTHKAGKLKEAIEIYGEVIRKNPRSAEALNWRGLAYFDLGEMDKALEDFSKAIEINPNYSDALNNRGEVFRKKQMYREAMNDYRRAAQLEPNFAEAYYNMGLVNELENRPTPAVNAYENYLKFKPDASDKSEIENKIKTLRQAATVEPKTAPSPPSPPPVAQKPAEPAPTQPTPVPKPTPPGAVKPPAPPKPGVPRGVDLGAPGMPGMPTMPGMPGMQGMPLEMLAGMAKGVGILGAVLPLAFYLFSSIMLFLIAKKTNTSLPWLAFIPIANVVLMVNIAGKPLWWLLLLLLPIVAPVLAFIGPMDPTGGILMMIIIAIILLIPTVTWLLISLGIARARGKSAVWGVLLFLPCTNLIALAYLGLSE